MCVVVVYCRRAYCGREFFLVALIAGACDVRVCVLALCFPWPCSRWMFHMFRCFVGVCVWQLCVRGWFVMNLFVCVASVSEF